MKHSTRRDFLRSSALLMAAAVSGSSFDIKKKQQLLAFSTLGCPDWTFPEIVDFAVKNKYQGIEIRGIQRQVDLVKCPEFNSPENLAATKKIMEDKGLKFVGLGSSATLHFANGPERQKNLDEGRRFIDLAHDINCPYVRVFPNLFPKDQDKKATMELIKNGLLELGDHAKGGGVKVLLETHGDLVKIADIEEVMVSAEHPQVGLVWDIANMWTITQEPPALAWEKLKKYICHTHIKDAKMKDGKLQYTLLGRGEVPVFEALDVLSKEGYKGYYSFEWEKLWHPELEEPAIALADYSKVMRKRK